ncbi:hypothetical protein NXH76_04635 [Blautia schinkii]|nr:hypothetical protein [Blautia schinkii]
MVAGFESFKNWFWGYEKEYVIIGGTACDMLLSENERDFRVTKDIDMVLIVEAITPDFARKFWDYVIEAGYEHKNKSTGNTQFYRFSRPKSKEYPAMIEIFSRRLEHITLNDDAQLTPLPMEEDISSLSAILLNDTYYEFLKQGQIVLNGVPLLRTEYIIPFKAKAWIDLSERKAKGEQVDSKNIRKHKNDVFRLSALLNQSTRVKVSGEIQDDVKTFLNSMDTETIDLKSLGLSGYNKVDIVSFLKRVYGIEL